VLRILIPLWVLSGALFPLESAAGWLQWVMRLDPVTYSMVAIRKAFYAGPRQLATDGAFLGALAITAAWTGLVLVACVVLASRRSRS